MKTIRIETAANGYIATEGGRDMGMCSAAAPHVFETFDSLTKWLSQQLEKPKMPEAMKAPEHKRGPHAK